ncbi:5'-methylthioadenosine/S-adenosylhomocysteine nucleosidase [Polyangium aurulentum]|uniref:5'-methylthioadenosine/S-adenosylhomocysteine nucleosidase family protein n=1 Tax=Polyangium aurulentum TaxID=2567896 RepID=UPI0010ADBD93|nr:5'-methylthioadenosine/S-adenosylhomocysteine nucleosidase [Polyangium aurulentum]UQA56906.1 hypothetical protein E8A73_037275 [Polyangium aurulentum]
MPSPVVLCADIGVITVLPAELNAARRTLRLECRHKDERSGTVYFQGSVRSALGGSDYQVVLACVAGSGNTGIAALTSELIRTWSPKRMLLVGIAAGMREKVKIGEVVMAERVVAYEPAALVVDEGGIREEQRRPEILTVPNTMLQDVAAYLVDEARIGTFCAEIGAAFPHAPRGQKKAWKDVAGGPVVKKDVTIASGEKLLRDPEKLREVRAQIHGKVEAGDMEAWGFAKACTQQNVPWLVIRGISDFGDDSKDDRFHDLAARAAAAVMVHFIEHGLNLEKSAEARTAATTAPSAPSPFVWGRPIDRDVDFFGREAEKGQILEAIEKGKAVQILGGALVGKSSMLRWVERHAPGDRPLVWLEPGAGLSPTTLVATLAERLGRAAMGQALRQEGATADRAAEALRTLGPFVVLMDDADKLATTGKGFEEGFFEVVRGLVQDRVVAWISASTIDLFDVFQQNGLTSRFLNSSERIWLGPLEEAAAWKLAEQAPDGLAARMIADAGYFAFGLQWLGDQLHRRSPDRVEETLDELAEVAARAFASWWALLSVEQQRALRQCASAPIPAGGLSRPLRGILNRLVGRGYLIKKDGAYHLAPGEAWARFVCDER